MARISGASSFSFYQSVFKPGLNCLEAAEADRYGVVIDGEDYFRAVKQAILAAKKSVRILGWEFDSRTRLERPEPEGSDHPNAIGPLLDHVARHHGVLVDVLIWDSALIYAINREFAGFVKMDWLTHNRVRFRFDDDHPIGACHHQKMVIIDESLCFLGGFDLTTQRWDDRRHLVDNPLRTDPGYVAYPAFHDCMAVFDGEAAQICTQLFKERWRRATGQSLEDGYAEPFDLWPQSVPVGLRDLKLYLSRTQPQWDGFPAITEIEQLYVDMIRAARHFIFIENQYFASRRICDELIARLAQPDCPEILIINPGEPVNIMERSTMGVARAKVALRLFAADHQGKVLLLYPAVEGKDTKVHSKVMIIDDQILRIGSSNVNNRSMVLDTECDVTFAAQNEGHKAFITAFRHDLMAEHLGVSQTVYAQAEQQTGSLFQTLARFRNQGPRQLLPVETAIPVEVLPFVAESNFSDLEEPLESIVVNEPKQRSVVTLVTMVAASFAFLGGMLVIWLAFRPLLGPILAPVLENYVLLKVDPGTGLASILLVFTASIIRIPLSLVVLGFAMVLGPWFGLLHSLVGLAGAQALAYGVGWIMGTARVRRFGGFKVTSVKQSLHHHGIMAMILLRLVPVAPFGTISLTAGALKYGFRDFFVGTMLGMAPGVIAFTVLGDRLLMFLTAPNLRNLGVALVVCVLIPLAQFGLIARILRASGPKASQPKSGPSKSGPSKPGPSKPGPAS